MGTWSIKPFGNDTALDWFGDLEESKDGSKKISKTIDAILVNYDGCSVKAEEAMAAISIIAAATVDPVKGTHQDAKSWINNSGFVPTHSLIENSISALDVITKDSELVEMWDEAESLHSWLKSTEKLKVTLSNTKRKKLPDRKPKKRVLPRTLYKLIKYYDKHPDKKIRDKILDKIKAIENVNEGDKHTEFYLPLSLAAYYGLEEEVKYLLEKGASPNAKSLFGESPFSQACVRGHLKIADLMLEAGAEIFGETVMDKNTGFAYRPERYENSQETPDLKTYKYCATLFSVASYGQPHVIDYLVNHGANIHQLDLNDETLIHKACYYENLATLEHLIKLGVDINATKGMVNANKNSRGETALHYAVSKNNLAAAKLLLDNGADPNIIEYLNSDEYSWKNTPLDLIKDDKQSAMYLLLVKHGAVLAEQINK